MSDNIKVVGSSDPSAVNLATESCTVNGVTGVEVPLGKLGFGAANSYTAVTSSVGLPVAVLGTVAVASVGGAVEIANDAGNPIPVNGTVEVTNDVGNPLPVSGTVTVTALPAGTNLIGSVAIAPSTTGGSTPYHLVSLGSTNATSIKASAGSLLGLQVFNTNAAARYLHLTDTAGAPTPGTTIPVKTILVPGGSAGGGTIVPFGSAGVAFATGIGFWLSTGAADNDTGAVGAGDLILNVDYK